MAQPKTQRSKDIAATNRIIENLNPYLFFEREMNEFVTQRTAAQISEIKDRGFRAVSEGSLFFAMNNTDLGIESMENAIAIMSDDMVTWRTYMQCVFWRMGPIAALEVSKRANKMVISPLLLRDSFFYSAVSGDYDYASQMHNKLLKTNALDEIVPIADSTEREDMERYMATYEIAKKADKLSVIKSLSELMFSQLSLGQKIQTSNRIVDVSESDDEISFIYELHIVNADSKKCAEMTRHLISQRVEAGIVDWDVGSMFVSKSPEEIIDACNS
ncbi:hypothetical protein J1780_19740 [Rahnella aceris]|uniref:hypothetical protein n=1 Tax=Rahnella sp. (strain Y9602) TaxID=2703885 RepID=UPI001C27585C|nr:hypothetical protein [Rahnella aceris]MBU9842184.1 hypothetical protein [Rahnella aceris]